jgi:hypothetical protein
MLLVKDILLEVQTWFDAGDITLTANFMVAPNNGVIPVTIVELEKKI